MWLQKIIKVTELHGNLNLEGIAPPPPRAFPVGFIPTCMPNPAALLFYPCDPHPPAVFDCALDKRQTSSSCQSFSCVASLALAPSTQDMIKTASYLRASAMLVEQPAPHHGLLGGDAYKLEPKTFPAASHLAELWMQHFPTLEGCWYPRGYWKGVPIILPLERSLASIRLLKAFLFLADKSFPILFSKPFNSGFAGFACCTPVCYSGRFCTCTKENMHCFPLLTPRRESFCACSGSHHCFSGGLVQNCGVEMIQWFHVSNQAGAARWSHIYIIQSSQTNFYLSFALMLL